MFKISNKISNPPKSLLNQRDHPIGCFRHSLVDFVKKATLATFFRAARETFWDTRSQKPGFDK
jgi:hypothetical protein